MSGLPRATPRVLAEVVSPTFDVIATEVNRRSVNIGAELMLRWGGGVTGAPGHNCAREMLRDLR